MSRMLRLSQDQFAALVKRQKGSPRPLAAPPVDSGQKNDERGLAAISGASGGRPSKYRSRATGGYASVKEARRAAQLKLMAASGVIRGLEEQVAFELIPTQYDPVLGGCWERACKYIADFVYQERIEPIPPFTTEVWVRVVEDVKSPVSRTKDYRIKRKLMLWRHGVRIRET